MRTIAWHDRLALGDPRLDAQHKALIELIARMPENPSDDDGAFLEAVARHAAEHFADEESFMIQIGYPGLSQQQREHWKFGKILAGYQGEYDQGNRDFAAFKQFMFNWVRDHILGLDRRIADYVRTNRIPTLDTADPSALSPAVPLNEPGR